MGGTPVGCYALPFEVKFEWQIFCTTNQLNDFVQGNAGASPCVTCNTPTVLTFQRGVTSISDLIVESGFSQDLCNLVWTLSLKNPLTMPQITFSELDIMFSTGMIYQIATAVVSNYSGSGIITQPNLTLPPTFSLVSSSGPSFNAIETTLELTNLNLLPGQQLTYTINFSLSEQFCNTQLTPSSEILNDHLEGHKFCNVSKRFSRAITAES
jgi:hypothetical protein